MTSLAAFALLTAGLSQATASTATTTKVLRVAGTHAPAFVTGITERPVADHAAAAARRHLADNPARYGIIRPNEDLETISIDDEATGATVRFQQVYRGLPVFGAHYLVHLQRSGGGFAPEAVNGHFFTELTVDADPDLSRAAAIQLARLRSRPIQVDEVRAHGLTVLPIDEGVLTYHLTLWGSRLGAPVKQQVFVDAHSGTVTLSFNDLQGDQPVVGSGTTSHGETVPLDVFKTSFRYEMRDRSRPMFAQDGEIRTHDLRGSDVYLASLSNLATSSSESFTGSNTTSGAVDAHHAAGEVYEYFRALGRNSIDDRGMSIVSLVNARDAGGRPLYNAFWDGRQMVYGNPNPRELHPLSADVDVVGHELTHGVTQTSGKLIFLNQAGAMNEAYSDYFGNAIDVDVSGTSMTAPMAGYIGEDLCKVASPENWQCPLRDLNDGTTTSDYLFYLADLDNGGVHFNTTIYGGALWDIREALGSVADRYVYRALTDYTTPLQDFFDGRNAVVAAASAEGAPQAHIDAINGAFDRRGITQDWDTSSGPAADSILMRDVAPIGIWFGAPNVSGDRFVIGDYPQTKTSGPLRIYAGKVDGSGAPRKVGEDASPSTYSDESPDITGKRVVWAHAEVRQGIDFDIHSRVLGGGVQSVARGSGFQWFPSIEGKLLAWEDTRSGATDIWARYLGKRARKVTGAAGDQWMPEVVGDWVAWWNPPIGGRQSSIGLKNMVSGKEIAIRPSSSTGFVGPPGAGPGYVYWYEDSNLFSSTPDYEGAIMRAKVGSRRKAVVVPEGTDASPLWAGLSAPPTPSANRDLVTYTDEYGYVARFVRGDAGLSAWDMGRDVWMLPSGGGTPQRVSTVRGDQAYAAMATGRRVVWLDGSRGRTDLVTRVVP